MLTHGIKLGLIGALFAGALAYAPPAAADSASIGIRIGRDAGISLFFGDRGRSGPYAYDGYRSGYWYADRRPSRRHVWNSRYRGYDCHTAFMYDYYSGRRSRYASTVCYDRGGSYFIAPGTVYIVADFNGRRWNNNRRWVDDRRWNQGPRDDRDWRDNDRGRWDNDRDGRDNDRRRGR